MVPDPLVQERLSRLLQSYMYELEAVHQDAAAMCEDFESCLLRILQDSEPRAPTHGAWSVGGRGGFYLVGWQAMWPCTTL